MFYLDWKKLLFVPICLLCLYCLPNAQTNGKIEKTIHFDGKSVEKTIPIDISSGTHSLSAVLKGEIETGSLYVSIIDPDGNRRNGFSLVCGDSEDAKYEVTTSSGGSVFNVHKSGSGSNEVKTESKGSGTSSVTISSSGSGSGNTITIHSNEEDDKNKEKEKEKDKNKNKNSNSNSNSDDDSTYSYVSSNDQTGAKGVFAESIDDPMQGTWKFVIKGEDVKGKLEIEVDQN